MRKNEIFKSFASTDSKEKSFNENLKNNKETLSIKLSDKFSLINEESSNQKDPENSKYAYNSDLSNYFNFKTKKVTKKNMNNSHKKNSSKPNKEEKDENIKDENFIEHQHYKNFTNTNEKDFNNKNNSENKLKKNISNFNPNRNKTTDIIKNIINSNKNINKNDNNTFYNNNYGKNLNNYKKKINNNLENKFEKILSFMNNNNYNKNNINITNSNQTKTNPNNEINNSNNKAFNNYNSDMKTHISINKKYDKNSSKLNLDKNKYYGQTPNNSSIKQINYNRTNKDNNDENLDLQKKPSIDILKSIRGNLMPFYNSTIKNTSNEIINNSNYKKLGSSHKLNQSKNSNRKNIINFFLPNKDKRNNNNQNENNNNIKIGNLQNIIMKDDENDDNANDNFNKRKIRIYTQTNSMANSKKNNIQITNNIKENSSKIINKSIGLRKNRTIIEKNDKNIKKDLTLNNKIDMKKRQRYLDKEINSHILDSTNILGNNIKNKNTYLNLIRKAFNNKNKNYYINFMSNKNDNSNNELISQINNDNRIGKNNVLIQKPIRDSKSLNIIRNRSNKKYIDNNNNKKVKNVKEPYMNRIIKISNNKDKNRNYSVNQNNIEYNMINSDSKYENNILSNKLNNTHNNIEVSYNLKNEIEDNKVSENIENNSISTYSIFIFHKFYKNINKIGLRKIKIFDINNIEIPVIFYKTNAEYDDGSLFNTMMANISLFSKTSNLSDEIKENIPFVTEIKKDINIFFHINSNKSNNIKYIQIINYNNKENLKINSVKNIEIFKGQNLIYKGILNDDINNILLPNINKNNNLNYINNIFQERPFSTSKIRTKNNSRLIQSQLNTNSKNSNNKNDFEAYHTARNNLLTRLNDEDNFSEEDENNNNNKLFSKTEGMIKEENSDKKENNASNTINIHINNNTNNITNLEFFEKNEKIEEENNVHYFEAQNSSENKKYNENISINKNEENNDEFNNFNDNNNTLNQNLDMSFGKNNFEKENNEIEINEENSLNNNILNQDLKEINYKENENKIIENNNNDVIITNLNENLINTNSTLYNTFNSNDNNYIYFNRIKFIITSNYGHKKHVGLTGIEFYNLRGELVNIEKAIAIGAFPKDLRTIYDDENDNRIFENVFNNTNDTDDAEDMWVTKLNKKEPKTFIDIYFKEKIKISKIKFYNYNEKNNLHIGAKTIDLYLDDNYYGTIHLKQGIGEIAHDSIKLNKDKDENNDSEDGNNHYKEDFGQIITFPIKNLPEIFDENRINKFNIKHASFLYEQSYETPFMPCGYYIKFEFLSNYYKGIAPSDEAHPFKYKDIGLDSIEIYNNENINIIGNKNIFTYKIISNREFHNKKDKIILNGAQSEDGNNCLFYIFDMPIQVSYIKFNPLTKNMRPKLNSVKEIKIYCEAKIIFEGELYLEHPTVALFTCDTKIKKNIEDKFLTKKTLVRDTIEIKNDQYFSLILN